MNYDIDKWDLEDIDDSPLNNKNKRDVEMTREYCDEHEFFHQLDTCEPTWEENGDLDLYIITIHDSKKKRDAFIKKRNKKANHKPKKFKKK